MKAIMSVLVISGVVFSGSLALVYSEDNPHGDLLWDCADCHSTESWDALAEPMAFSHAETGFRLDGGHQKVACRSCHGSLTFSHVGTACADCHADHHQGQLGSDCRLCHSIQGWQPQTDLLVQHAERGFPLTGVHAIADCEACHRGTDRGQFIGTPTDCETCHLADAGSATDPDHSALAFGNNCQLCHHAAFGSWEQTTYEHPGTFPLTGAHRSARCSGCHATTFAGTPVECFACHEPDYQATTDPPHQAASFPTTCNECHSTTGWTPANWDHDTRYFPIYSGEHRGEWNTCGDCHTVVSDYSQFDCTACHEHRQSRMDDEHRDIQGYQYLSSACYECHPQGRH